MTREREVVVLDAPSDVAIEVADRFVEVVRALASGVDARAEVHVAVSGGSVATAVFPEIVARGDEAGIDWSGVHVWFVDERFVPRGDDDRNVTPIAHALRRAAGFVPEHLHATLSSELGVSLGEAAARYEAEIRANVPPAEPGGAPSFDLVLLGAGPDGHTASLFPGHAGALRAQGVVTSVDDSPKPPPRRLTLTLDAIAAASRVWAIATGAGKADAVALALHADVPALQSPLGAAHGRDETVLFLDAGAAAGIQEAG